MQMARSAFIRAARVYWLWVQKKSRSRSLAERLSGELFGLTFGLRTFGKKVSQRITQEDNQTKPIES
jgi:hypothetical protein